MADAPKRACRFVLDLQADNRQELADALYNMASRIERGEMTKGVSGGYSSGFTYELLENDRPTHDEYVRDLRAYLDAKQAADEAGVPAAQPMYSAYEPMPKGWSPADEAGVSRPGDQTKPLSGTDAQPAQRKEG